MVHRYWPFVLLERRRPCSVELEHRLGIPGFRARVGKQRGNQPQRVDFAAQAYQVHLFITQNLVYVFHGHQAGPAMAPKTVLALKYTPRFFRLD